MTAWSLTPVCSACVEQVERDRSAGVGTLCGVCGEALDMESVRFADAAGASACTMCRLAPPEFTRAVAYSSYDDELREMVHLLKYERMRRLADAELGRWMAESIAQLANDASSDVTVMAVPLFPARERRRGFNQSVVLADAAMVRLRKSMPAWKLVAAHGAMDRVRDTDAQFGLQPRARRRNLRGAFRVCDDKAVRGREVLLVDDILTTGATARECARVLMQAGAAKVWVATLARAQTVAAVAMWEEPPEA